MGTQHLWVRGVQLQGSANDGIGPAEEVSPDHPERATPAPAASI
jgi:hypothetical protein